MIEAFIVSAFISVMVAIGGTLAAKYATHRSVDNLTKNISSTLQIAKLKSARHGVEYRAVFASCTDLDESNPDCPVCNTYVDYIPGDDTVTLSIERGDSNKGSTKWCLETSQTKKIKKSISLVFPAQASHFNPDGTGSAGTCKIHPTPSTNAKRCGDVIVNPFGRIRVTHGNWDGTTCKPIRER